MLDFSSRTWWLILGIFAIISVISIITFAAQCLGCCPPHNHAGPSASYELRHFPTAAIPPPGPLIIQISGVPPPPRRPPRKAKIPALTPELLQRLPSFYLGSTSKADCLEDRECAICQEDMGQTKVTSLPCGHLFHKECVKEWLQRKATCPTCRLLLSEKVMGGQIQSGDVEEGGIAAGVAGVGASNSSSSHSQMQHPPSTVTPPISQSSGLQPQR